MAGLNLAVKVLISQHITHYCGYSKGGRAGEREQEKDQDRQKERELSCCNCCTVVSFVSFFFTCLITTRQKGNRPLFQTPVYFCVFTFSHSFSLLYFCCSLSLWTDRWEQKSQAGSPDPWPLIANLGSSAGLLWVAKWVGLTSTLTVTPGHWQLLFACNSTHWAWEKERWGVVKEIYRSLT